MVSSSVYLAGCGSLLDVLLATLEISGRKSSRGRLRPYELVAMFSKLSVCTDRELMLSLTARILALENAQAIAARIRGLKLWYLY